MYHNSQTVSRDLSLIIVSPYGQHNKQIILYVNYTVHCIWNSIYFLYFLCVNRQLWHQICCTSNSLLTYSVVQSPPWEANRFAASQEIPCISHNPKVHYLTHKRPPPVSILVQPNPVHIPTFHLLEIHPNIIHPSMPRSPQWSLSFRFPHQDPIHPCFLTHTSHIPSQSHSSRFYHPHNIGRGVQIV